MRRTLAIILSIYELPIIIIMSIIIGINILTKKEKNIGTLISAFTTMEYIVTKCMIPVLFLSTVFWIYILVMFIM